MTKYVHSSSLVLCRHVDIGVAVLHYKCPKLVLYIQHSEPQRCVLFSFTALFAKSFATRQSLADHNTCFAVVLLMLESKYLQLDDNIMLRLKAWYF